ncbi:hypothetical protein K4K58_001275 [Colletotrichum sp. SAR11_239]|nr:hypothetical protein K4K58_001275 [Colletotrichum sp. SAR11_239]
MSSRKSRTEELENSLEDLRGSDDAFPDGVGKGILEKKRVEEDNASAQNIDFLKDGEAERGKKQQRTNKIRKMGEGNRNSYSFNVGDYSESSYVDSSNRGYDGRFSADDNDAGTTEIENGEEFICINKDGTIEVINDKLPKVEIRNVKSAKSQKGNNTSKKHRIQGREVQNPKKAQNGHQLEQRQADDKKKRRRGDADDLDGNREDSPNRDKRIRRDNEVKESSSNDKIIQIMKFIRRMALLPDERLMQNLQHGFPLHAQDTVLAGFRIIEWFQGTGSEMEDA